MKTKLFYAILLSKHVSGADNVYQFFCASSQIKLGMIDGNFGTIAFQGQNWYNPEALKDLTKLTKKIVNHCNK